MKAAAIFLATATLAFTGATQAADVVLDPYTAAAKQATAGFSGFSAQRGEQLFRGKHTGAEHESCTSCHTTDARKPGQHEKTGKTIEPMAPSVNAKRFTDTAKVEKWFRRNCKEVLARECTVVEKGDFVTYMRGIK